MGAGSIHLKACADPAQGIFRRQQQLLWLNLVESQVLQAVQALRDLAPPAKGFDHALHKNQLQL